MRERHKLFQNSSKSVSLSALGWESFSVTTLVNVSFVMLMALILLLTFCLSVRLPKAYSKWKLKIESIPLHSRAEVVNWLSCYASLCSGGITKDRDEFLIFAAVLYHNLWFFRNDIYHNHTQWIHTEMMKRVQREFSCHWKCYVDTNVCNEGGSNPIMTRWALPRSGRIRLNVDFATNKGIGAVGVVVREAGGNILTLFAIKTTLLSINHGELWAVLRGLEVISNFGYTMVDMFSDCQTMVNALLKASSPHWNVQMVFSKTLSLMSSLSVSPVWIPRTANQVAHVLAS
uniref:RNase H type-1 domain-containing protein n=1 Tax=Cannabis sativa TaxID=3483 RepID=A0A803PJJ6_CANSA